MHTFLETGTFAETMIDRCDTKLAIWSTLLPASKKDPLRQDGKVDEVMFMAHMMASIIISTLHRPFSSLAYIAEEFSTQAFLSPTPFVLQPKTGRLAHTARALKAAEMQTKFLAIPCGMERHNLFAMCISAQLTAAQVSACTNLLDGHALFIARDRVRLSIGFLNTMGSIWPVGKKMAKDVRSIARAALSNTQHTVTVDAGPAAAEIEIEMPRDELIWPVDPSAQIDIYSGIVIPNDWDATAFNYSLSIPSDLM
ncbi:hypothetical protein EJ02DRAFT_418397 [Clathrospora elynae]|uniref:Uncharacterized protein n=1 Tax=Clathrospora elynae TaxID=706981 RepID=A0A6A5T249_9PLEO|nr:hypothetical protein EJ02DRAFT_418397 [Clathrospora elynae]